MDWRGGPFLLLIILISGCFSQLTVNVKNKGGDILKESIQANTSQNTVTLDYQKADGSIVTQFIDFKNQVQIFKALVLGEEERGQSSYQVMCFVTRFINNEFISSDAMSKLRQKNPSAIRHPEEDKTPESHTMDLILNLEHANVISPHIATVCKDARDSTYATDNDLKVLSSTLNKDYTILLSATKHTSMYRIGECPKVLDTSRACNCNYEICVGWYPCGLKYCRGKDSSGKTVSYRCGIKTCSKCRTFKYYVRRKFQCIWDEEEVVFNIDNKPEYVIDNKDDIVEDDPGMDDPRNNLDNAIDPVDGGIKGGEGIEEGGDPANINVIKK